MPYRAKNMGDGWETKRRRGPGHDWVILKLGVPGTIHRVVVDTAHFKGNYPDSCSLEAADGQDAPVNATNAHALAWQEVLLQTKLQPNHRHEFRNLQHLRVATHVRFNIYPDGGVSRLRIFGRSGKTADIPKPLRKLNRLPQRKAIKIFLDCCGSKRWAERLAGRRPFASAAEMLSAADAIWPEMKSIDWMEAFRHHPPIGEKRDKAKQSSTASRWSAKEQSTAQKAAPEVLSALAEGNLAYAKKFGYVFLICATGKTCEEILRTLRQRMPNDPETELRSAAEEQRKITRLRMEKLLAS